MSSPIPFNPSINLPIHANYYLPRLFDISNIVLGPTTTVTTSVNHNYVIGQLVRLHVPNAFGSSLLSGQDGYVISIPAANMVVINLNSTLANPYVVSPAYAPTPAQIAAIGDINSGPINSQGRINNGTFIQGSFINVSPAFDG